MTQIISNLRAEADALIAQQEVVVARGGYATLGDRLDAMDPGGGIVVSSEGYILGNWAAALERLNGAPTPHGTYPDLIGSANVIWPDGSNGVYTAVTVNATWLEATHWTLTHVVLGLTLTFSGLVRDANGFITTPGTFVVA